MEESRTEPFPKLNNAWAQGPTVSRDIGAITITSGEAGRTQLWVLAPIVALPSILGAVMDGRIGLVLCASFFLLYCAGLFLKQKYVSVSLTVLPHSIIIMRRKFSGISREVLPLETIARVDVSRGFLRGYPLRLVQFDGATCKLVLGQRSDHEAIATWLNERLINLAAVLPPENVVPLALRNLRSAQAERVRT